MPLSHLFYCVRPTVFRETPSCLQPVLLLLVLNTELYCTEHTQSKCIMTHGHVHFYDERDCYICAEKREEIGRSHQYSEEHVTNISKNIRDSL